MTEQRHTIEDILSGDLCPVDDVPAALLGPCMTLYAGYVAGGEIGERSRETLLQLDRVAREVDTALSA